MLDEMPKKIRNQKYAIGSLENRRLFLKSLLLTVTVPGLANTKKATLVDIRNFGASHSKSNVDVLQKAIIAAQRSGGTVYIPPGIWPVELNGKSLWQAIRIPSNVSIVGKGNESVIKLTGFIKNRASVFLAENVENIVLSNFTIDCSFYGYREKNLDARVNGITFKRCTACIATNLSVVDGYGYGIWLLKSKDCLIERCFVRNFEDNIELTDSHNSKVNFNWIHVQERERKKFFYSKASVNSGIILYNASSGNLVTNNFIVGGKMGAGISTYSHYKDADGKDPTNNKFINNSIDIDGHGVLIAGEEMVISGNVVKSKRFPALAIWDNSKNRGLIVSDNVFYARFYSKRTGPYWNPYCIFGRGLLQGGNFTKNTIISPDQGGVYLKGSDITFQKDNTIVAKHNSLDIDERG